MLKLPENYLLLDPFHVNREEDYFSLRWEVLRKPWGQPKGTERDDLENSSLHRMILNEKGDVIATGRLQLNDPREAQIRYMAVHHDFRGMNLGKMLIQELESLASDAGAEKLILQARENAVPFYTACGYTVISETFLLYDSIQHYLMEKNFMKDHA